jgi:hypothetical protein
MTYVTEDTRAAVLMRDNMCCVICGRRVIRAPREYALHHVNYDGDMPENLITLCVPCHNKEHTFCRPNEKKLFTLDDAIYRAREVFKSHVRVTGNSTCWNPRVLDTPTQIYLRRPDKKHSPLVSAKRLSYYLEYGAFLPGRSIKTRCGNKKCCNPVHLYDLAREA